MGSSVLKKNNEEDKKKKAAGYVVDQRIYQVGQMLRRKTVPFILQYASTNWKIGARQTRTYMRKARADWKNYSEKLKANARAYSLAKLRDLNDQAHSKKVVVGTIDNKQIIQVADLGLILDISKEENKLMGIYPAEKHEETRRVIVLGAEEDEKDKK